MRNEASKLRKIWLDRMKKYRRKPKGRVFVYWGTGGVQVLSCRANGMQKQTRKRMLDKMGRLVQYSSCSRYARNRLRR